MAKLEEKNQKILRSLLQLPDNKRCADCVAKGPVYANTTFHTFVCTTCSGVHREHNWRVKSVSMSSFTPEEIKALQAGGNKAAREVWLAKWKAEDYPEPEAGDVEKIREWITKKYADKRWYDASKESHHEAPPKPEPLTNILGNNIPPIKVEANKPAAPAAAKPAAAPKSDSFANFGDFSFDDAAAPASAKPAAAGRQGSSQFGSIAIPDHHVSTPPPAAAPASSASAGLVDLFDAPLPSPAHAPAPAAAPSLSGSSSANKALDLGALYSQTPSPVLQAQTPQQQFFNQPQPQSQGNFFGQPAPQQQQQQFPNAGFPQQFPPQQQQQQQQQQHQSYGHPQQQPQQQQFGQPQQQQFGQFGQPYGQPPQHQSFGQPGGFPAQGGFAQAPQAQATPFGQPPAQYGGFPPQQQQFGGSGAHPGGFGQPQQSAYGQPYGQGSPGGFPGAGGYPAQTGSPAGFPGAAHPPHQQSYGHQPQPGFGAPPGASPFGQYPQEPAKSDPFANLSVPFSQLKVSPAQPAKPSGPPLGTQPAKPAGGDLFDFGAPSSGAAPAKQSAPPSGNLLDF